MQKDFENIIVVYSSKKSTLECVFIFFEINSHQWQLFPPTVFSGVHVSRSLVFCVMFYGSMFVLYLFHLTIVLYVMSHCLSFFFFIWQLYCLLWVIVCPLSFSFDHCIVCYGSLFVHCLFHLTIVLSVMGQCLSFVFFIWPLYCLLWVIVCPFSFSFDHCIVCYGSLFVLCLLTIVLPVLWLTTMNNVYLIQGCNIENVNCVEKTKVLCVVF